MGTCARILGQYIIRRSRLLYKALEAPVEEIPSIGMSGVFMVTKSAFVVEVCALNDRNPRAQDSDGMGQWSYVI